MSNAFPSDWETQPCFVAVIPKPLVPFVGGMLKIMELRGFWDADSFNDAYNAVVGVEKCLMATCLDDLIESNNRMYRMLDTALFGTEYTIESENPLIVTPPIPPARLLAYDEQDSLLGRLDRLTQLTDNTFNGTETPLYDYTPDVKTLLASIKDAIEAAGTDDDDMLAALQQIVLLLG